MTAIRRMGRIHTVILYLRIFVVVLLMSCLSPGPGAPPALSEGRAGGPLSALGEIRIVIQKSRNVLTLYRGMTPLKSYWAVFGKGYGDGDKREQGDKRTPEGEFYICSLNHSERFYKFMGISYPSINHAKAGLRRGIITESEYFEIERAIRERRQPPWDTALGGAVGIHGRLLDTAIKRTPNLLNWTDGCIALDNADVDEIFSVVSIGTPVIILR